MEKKEYCLDFGSKIQNKEKESLYKFFTRNSIIVFLDGFNEIIVPDFVEYIEHNYFDKNINIKRVLESKVATKIELEIDNQEISFIFEIKERRIRRLEIM